MLCVELVSIIRTRMHIHYPGRSARRARRLNRGEGETGLFDHPSLRLLEAVWMLTFVCVRVCVFPSRSSLQSTRGLASVSPPRVLSITLPPPPFCPEENATRVGSVAGPHLPSPSLPASRLPLIHSFCRLNPSPRGTCLTEGKNRDEIVGCGSIPSIPLSISAVIHQPMVVVVVVHVGAVWLDTALRLFSENGRAELWQSTETRV